MSPERWRKVSEIYNSALELDSRRQDEYLAKACAGDEELRREVVSLLRETKGGADLLERLEWAARDTSAPAVRHKLEPGACLGPYQIEVSLGKGGMGEVFAARDTRLHRSVALKILPPEFSADPGRRNRFLQEARAASALNHPN